MVSIAASLAHPSIHIYPCASLVSVYEGERPDVEDLFYRFSLHLLGHHGCATSGTTTVRILLLW